ncbi:MAG: DUF4105 domain-containing protein [Deltaproteobacteria bacterium]|nr:DUF4105 domain-containing protein [Deltaproteobacteria bacterium]
MQATLGWFASLPILLILVFATEAVAQPLQSDRASSLATLVERAERAGLHNDPVWLALLQIDPGMLGLGKTSSVSTQSFFLAPGGKHNPKKELEATLAGFFDPDVLVKDVEHPQCAFIARRHWLVGRLEISEDEMPLLACEHYENWRVGLGAAGLTLIYPEGFMNNPASMFGHTLLRIDAQGIDGQGTDSETDAGTGNEPGARTEEILGYAVDYVGEPGGDRGLVFIAKGTLGLYPGRFGIHPYYQQLRRYAEWENRDIWEYRLQVDDDELDFLMMHLWEMRGIDHPYLFFTENCSYHLFRLLELAKPELRELDTLRKFVIPIDTVRGALEVEGFVTDVRYRASPATRLEYKLQQQSKRVRDIARRVANEELSPSSQAVADLPTRDRAAALELAYATLRYSFVKGSREQTSSRGLARSILVARSKVDHRTEDDGLDAAVPPPSIRPDQGHDSAAASLAGGYRDDEAYVDFQFRPAFHGLMDREGGYPRHMQIRFFDVNLRYFPERDRVRLEELTLIEAVSLSPRSEVFQPFAWNLSVGLATRRVSSKGELHDEAVARGDIGGGLAWQPWRWLHVYGLATATLDAGPGLAHDVSLGPGARTGVYLNWPRDRFKSHFFADAREFVVGDRTLRLRAGTQQRLTLSRNTALLLEGTYNRVEGADYLQAELALQLHF